MDYLNTLGALASEHWRILALTGLCGIQFEILRIIGRRYP